ncbi:unnamed protein product [Penicillium salamii]|uniref:VWFA domain-containing protein n=1 Tax=Penicillium salamii TaxID=1612424 RepID=A0A9W4JCG0_9EURO|nr:unnamed protein product [Penicillium salamii]
MGTSWYSFSSKQRKERKALKALKALYDCTSPTHSSDRRPITEVTQERPPPYTARAIQIPTIEISSAEPDESQYAFLRDFDTVFLVDDSSSMQGPRWREAADAIAAIAPICTQYDSDGIDIYFLNHRRSSPRDRQSTWRQPSYQPGVDGYQQITTARQVQEIFNSVRPSGSTMVGTRLSDILDPYLRRVEAMHAAKKARGYVDPDVLVKPMNIITITDGEFTDDAEGVIIKTARKLDGPTCDAIPWQVGIQFFQIGNDARARDFLQQLDDDLRTGVQMRDIVDTIPWMRDGVPLNSDGILKTVLGAVNKRLDRQRL